MQRPSEGLQLSDTIQLAIEGMTCASCVRRVEKAIATTPGVTQASVNLATERADIVFDAKPDLPLVLAAIERAGYGAHPVAAMGSEDRERDARKAEMVSLRRSLVLSAVLTLPVFVI